jgi:hypothetical protein
MKAAYRGDTEVLYQLVKDDAIRNKRQRLVQGKTPPETGSLEPKR